MSEKPVLTVTVNDASETRIVGEAPAAPAPVKTKTAQEE